MATNPGGSNGVDANDGSLLWKHPSPRDTQMWHFLQTINRKHQTAFTTYDELYRWSISHVEQLWGEIWEVCGVRASQPYSTVVSNNATMFPRPTWFDNARLNFAENLLYPTQQVDEDSPAVIAATETARETVSWKQLREKVRHCQAGMLAMDVKAGDRVAGYVANHTNALVASLAAISLGAIWTAVSPDTGVTAVLDRMVQIEPALLFTDNAVMYNGKTHPVLPKVKEIIASLPTLKGTIIFETALGFESNLDSSENGAKVIPYNKFASMNVSLPAKIHFEQLPADHPIYILYSSGTTGAPKCIVHGAIGTLIQHKKEHMLQSDIRPGDRLMYFTTCTWMMWHWLISGLASGATLILYDGSPFQYLSDGSSVKDDLAMPKLIDELSINQFGTSAKYLSVLEQKNLVPADHGISLKSLKAIYSTGSPLAPSTFQYVYRAFGQVNLGSITGGTDIVSLFGAPCPLHPVYVGEIQVLGLGMAVQAWDYTGKDVSSSGEPGDLVCVKPFPCQPVMFWDPPGQPGKGAEKYKSSYFEQFQGVWHHGDFVRFNPKTGGLFMLGRSDGILKPSGVRFGSAEIYNIILKHFPEQVEDALCIGRRREQDNDETVVLFLKMREGVDFSTQLVDDIKSVVRKELSARHVPGIIDQCPEIPVTTNGKKVEGAVKQILCGMNVKTSASVANATCLDWYKDWARSHD
ncbi:hypothetical protein D0869_05502 [Hortaea werneckii]|uniref:AMP-dependent synthetase/ligase domain-containing protein n=2 Tax=Hortaea werneckii TaxID=91943 RepID=A0A3M6WY54_HORWE|nr:acetoacetate-CoA ligase [Hortaea werneckii]RMX83178.1 hypothetical protein D0869_05502 [Hortaea werneckii]